MVVARGLLIILAAYLVFFDGIAFFEFALVNDSLVLVLVFFRFVAFVVINVLAVYRG